ncbi:hypothetical protein [Bacillus safensis]|uniref:hypothetical protein n=1 Tax=Bacillus safensis TaxID=561879 RepID=UPI002E1F9E82|nr:hypothetical protein [Bacillus safensis]
MKKFKISLNVKLFDGNDQLLGTFPIKPKVHNQPNPKLDLLNTAEKLLNERKFVRVEGEKLVNLDFVKTVNFEFKEE